MYSDKGEDGHRPDSKPETGLPGWLSSKASFVIFVSTSVIFLAAGILEALLKADKAWISHLGYAPFCILSYLGISWPIISAIKSYRPRKKGETTSALKDKGTDTIDIIIGALPALMYLWLWLMITFMMAKGGHFLISELLSKA